MFFFATLFRILQLLLEDQSRDYQITIGSGAEHTGYATEFAVLFGYLEM